ncbi:thioredoxin family protein [Pontimonas sp.]|nr:thioredoxin family protein [Pontimonas sp.]
MDPLQIALSVGALLIAATLLGFAWQNKQGSVSRNASPSLPSDVPLDLIDSASTITLLQFSGPFCSYCAAMRVVLEKEAQASEGLVAHREIDITDYPELTSSLKVATTPTTFIVTRSGHILSRILGAAKPPVVAQEVHTALLTRKAQSDEYLI